jgi:hypothetical protein
MPYLSHLESPECGKIFNLDFGSQLPEVTICPAGSRTGRVRMEVLTWKRPDEKMMSFKTGRGLKYV